MKARPLGLLFLGITTFCLSHSSGAAADPQGLEMVEISAPIFPQVLVMYEGEGTKYPESQALAAELAHKSALTFPFLLDTCSKLDKTIVLQDKSGPALSKEQLAANYSKVAQCAYEQYTAKPYWIPKLVDDVDICGSELGAGWRLLTQADVESLDDKDFVFIRDTLSASLGADSWSSFYYSLSVFVRATDGSIQSADLRPGVTERIAPLPVSGEALKQHLELGLALRCIRRSSKP